MMSSPHTENVPDTETSEEDLTVQQPSTSSAALQATASFNPSVSDDDDTDADLERAARGDAIGSTLYSERYVLSILVRLTKVDKDLRVDDDFEKELCALWDMTIEEDVVKLMLEHNILELCAQCIEITEDKRLAEILVGVLGNLCSNANCNACEALCASPDVLITVLRLISCSDTLTLVQLMRLLAVILVKEDIGTPEAWFQHFLAVPDFVQDFCSILCNSMNETLLRGAMEALNAIFAKFCWNEGENVKSPRSVPGFNDYFVKSELVKSTIEAFDTLMPRPSKLAMDEIMNPSLSIRKTLQIFLNIQCILVQNSDDSRACYLPHVPQIIDCMGRILEALAEPTCLLPLSYYEYDVIANISELLMEFGDPFDEACVDGLISIWEIVYDEAESRRSSATSSSDVSEEFGPKAFDYYDFSLTLLDFIIRITIHGTAEQLQTTLALQPPTVIEKLLAAINEVGNEDHLKTVYDKIKAAFDSLAESPQ